MTPDIFTIALSCTVVAVALWASMAANPLFRKFTPWKDIETDEPTNEDDATDDNTNDTKANATDKSTDTDNETTDIADTPTSADSNAERASLSLQSLPKVSVLVVSNGTPGQMDAHIAAILAQDYPAGFEVIAVAAKGDSATEDVLKRHALSGKVYTTFVPGRSLFMSRSKIAVTIGVKAAHNEWVLVTDSRYAPVSDKWLATMASNCTDDATDYVLGYTNYTSEATAFERFERLREQAYVLRRAMRSTALCTKGANLMFRKSRFIDGDGYRGNLQYLQGEYDFLLNKHAERGNTTVESRPDAWLMEDAPSKTTWRNEHMSFINYRNSLNGIASYRLLHCLDTFFMHFNYLLSIASTTIAALTENWILLATSLSALLFTIVLRTVTLHRVSKRYCAEIPTWATIFLELRCFWSSALCKLRYIKADKNEFTSHKL